MESIKIYATENDGIGTKARFRITDGKWVSKSIGICAGMSLLWCRNIVDGKEGKETKPGYSQAALLQGIYEMNGENSDGLEKVYELLGLTVIQKNLKQSSENVITRFKFGSGLYQLMIPNHSMAVRVDAKSIAEGEYQLFDPDEGLFHFYSFDDLRQKLINEFKYCLGEDWGWVKFSRLSA